MTLRFYTNDRLTNEINLLINVTNINFRKIKIVSIDCEMLFVSTNFFKIEIMKKFLNVEIESLNVLIFVMNDVFRSKFI